MKPGIAIVGLLVTVALAIAFANADAPPTVVTTTRANTKAPTVVPQLASVGSCSASACHGASEQSAFQWQSAFTVWASKDHHARAYDVLFDPRSIRMTTLLGLGDQPYHVQLCLNCHTIQGHFANTVPDAFLADGVSCEACHGIDQGWVAAHTQPGWKRSSSDLDLGLVDTKDMTRRAKVCVECHVGSPGRDVNHDLIAAGHPRLAFELHSYQQAMPPHWKSEPNEDPIDVWATGRKVALEADINLLNQRTQASQSTASDGMLQQPWPEFAEFDCYGCHQPFRPSTGQEWTAAKPPLGLPRKNPWHFALIDLIPPISKSFTDLPAAWIPWSEPKQSDLAQLREITKNWASQPSTVNIEHLLKGIAGVDASNWDQAAQAYLALSAVVDHEIQSTPVLADKLLPLLAALRNTVQFHATLDSKGEPHHYDSPRDYSPSRFREAMEKLLKQLEGK